MLASRKMSSDTFFFTERKQLLSETLKALARRKTVHGLCSIYHGLEADLYKLVYPGRKTAVKITTSIHPDGNVLWPGLKHKNVLRILETFSLTILDTPVTIYVMPYKERCLASVIEAKSFGLQHGDYPRIKIWLRQVLSGLKYLHSKGLCHLNVAIDNVVLTSKSRAQLCDFDSLCKDEDPIDRSFVGLSWWFQPPEVKVSGHGTDLWSFGLLVIDCVTKLSLANGKRTLERSWELDVLPRMRRTLQTQDFSRLVRRSYPATDIPDKDLLRTLDFINGFLQSDPGKRTTAARAKKHPFVTGTKRRWKLVAPDPVWIEEGHRDVANQTSVKSATEEANISGDGITEDDVSSAQTGAFSLEVVSDGPEDSIELISNSDSFISAVEITEDDVGSAQSGAFSFEGIRDEPDKQQVPQRNSFIQSVGINTDCIKKGHRDVASQTSKKTNTEKAKISGYGITENDVGYPQTRTLSLDTDSDGLDEPMKHVSVSESFISAVDITEDNGYQQTRTSSLNTDSDGFDDPIEHLSVSESISTVEITEDVGYRPSGTPSLDTHSDGLDPIEHVSILESISAVEITEGDVGYQQTGTITNLDLISDGLYDPIEHISVSESISAVEITEDDFGYQQTGTPSLDFITYGLDDPLISISDSSICGAKLTEGNEKTGTPNLEVIPNELHEPIEQICQTSYSKTGVEITQDYFGFAIPIWDGVLDESIEHISDSLIPDAVMSEGKDIPEPIVEITSEESSAETIEQVNNEARGKLNQFPNRPVAKTIEKIKVKDLKPDEFELFEDLSSDSNVEEMHEETPPLKPNLRSVLLSPRFNSSTVNKEGTRFTNLRFTVSRVAGNVSAKKKTSKQRLLS